MLGAQVFALGLAAAERLEARWDGRHLRVRVSGLQLLSGRHLEQVRNGRSVPLDFHLSLLAGAVPLRKLVERFIFSYDLWEERFSVTRPASEHSRRSFVSHVSQPAAEAWCFDQFAMPTEGIAADRPIMLRLEIRAPDPDQPPPALSEPGLSLAALIELFSRPARPGARRWSYQLGPMTLGELRVKNP